MGYRLKDLYEWYEDNASSRSILEALNTANQFIFNEDGTFEADAVSTDKAVINEYDAILEATSDQNLSDTTTTQKTWDQGSDSFSSAVADPSNNKFVIPSDGKYRVTAACRFLNGNSGDSLAVIPVVNGTRQKSFYGKDGTGGQAKGSYTLDLSANDDLTLNVRNFDTAGDVQGLADVTFYQLERVA